MRAMVLRPLIIPHIEKFEEDAVQAAGTFSEKRKKKHLFTEDGIPIEPFSVRQEQQEHIFDSTIVKDTKKDGSWDPWLLSVEEHMQNLEKEDALREANSEKLSESDDLGEEDVDEPLLDFGEDEPRGDPDEEKLQFLEETISFLQPSETG